MIEKYYNDYFKGKITARNICELESISNSVFIRRLKKVGLKPYKSYYKDIKIGDDDLNKMLRNKYSSIASRCSGNSTDKYGHYNGLDYMTIQEYVLLCNENKELLNYMWNEYIDSGKDRKHTISVDRINNNKGYVVGNLQFILNGFNSWKRGITPVRVTHKGETKYFMSSEEASRSYGLRKQTINECLRKTPYHLKGYDTELSSVEEVLNFVGVKSIEEYYGKYIR